MIKIFLVLSIFISINIYAKSLHPISKIQYWCNEEKKKTNKKFLNFATLATVSCDGHPHTRLIQLTNFNKKEGALFFTNKRSQKVIHIEYSQNVAVNIWLPKTQRQISIEGIIKEVSLKDTEKYWRKLPFSSKALFLHEDTPTENNKPSDVNRKVIRQVCGSNNFMPDTFVGYWLIPKKIIFREMHPKKFPSKEISHL